MTRHNITDILAIQDAAENSNYWQFIDWLEMNDCEIFNAEGKTFDFNYKSVVGTVTKRTHLNAEFDLYDDADWIDTISIEIIRFKPEK